MKTRVQVLGLLTGSSNIVIYLSFDARFMLQNQPICRMIRIKSLPIGVFRGRLTILHADHAFAAHRLFYIQIIHFLHFPLQMRVHAQSSQRRAPFAKEYFCAASGDGLVAAL